MLAEKAPHFVLDRLRASRLFREYAYVGGRWTAAADGADRVVTDPASGQEIGRVPVLGEAETREAVALAQAAFGRWRALLPQERARLLRAWHDAILESADDLAALMTLEQGKPLAEARGEIDYAASFVEWYAEEARRVNVESVTGHLPGAEVALRREPVGVAALITPWNFPSAMITRKAAAALAAGCAVVVHPSMETPFSALALAELAERAGLPAGLFNVVTGDPETVVGALCADKTVRAVSFTGSTGIGRLIGGLCAQTVKTTVLELGGHAPFILFPDADFEKALDAAVPAKFATSGQDCLAANRFYLHRDLYHGFAAAFAQRVAALEVGGGFEPGVEIGPLMNQRAVEKCERHVADALARGARLMTGGKRHARANGSGGGLFFEPTVLVDVPDDALIMHEETFGPVAALTVFDDEAEVLARANDTDFGLIAYLHTRDHARIGRMTRGLEFGMVAVNRTKVTGAPVPFGGMKQSGLGREGSRLGLEAFTEVKYLCLDAA